MSDKPECAECDEEIDGEVVWYRSFGKMMQEDSRTWRFINQASSDQMENSLPFHPKCFQKRTGEKWPIEVATERAKATLTWDAPWDGVDPPAPMLSKPASCQRTDPPPT